MSREERVEIFIPKGYANEEPNLLVGINGVTYLLPRGKTSKVPVAVAQEVERSRAAQNQLDQRMDEMMRKE